MKAGLWLGALWLALMVILPTDRESTVTGTWLAKGISAFGVALLLWLPIVGVIAAVKWARRKT